MTDFLELLVSAAEAGSIYSLVALAYLLVIRPTGVINFATGEWAALGAFFSVGFITWMKFPVWIAIPVCVVCVGLIGLITERAAVRPLIVKRAPHLSPVLALLGMLIIYRESLSWGFGVDNFFVPMPLGFGRVEFGPFAGTTQSFLIISATLVVMIAAYLFFEKTLWGKAFQAVAINRDAAAYMGINLNLVGVLAFAGGAGVAAFAGVLQAPLTSVHFLMGLPLAIKGFAALVIGGVGRVEATLLGGLLLALLEKLTIRYAPVPSGFALAVPLILLILFLLLRPNGLLPPKEAR